MRESTARDLIIDICNSLAAFGICRFYVINTGVSTEKPLAAAAAQLAQNDIQLRFLKLSEAYKKLPDSLFTQTYGSHADERETSLMLHIAPEAVQFERATCDGIGSGWLSRLPDNGTYSPSGVFGDATLATAEKGEQFAQHMITHLCEEIDSLISTSLHGIFD